MSAAASSNAGTLGSVIVPSTVASVPLAGLQEIHEFRWLASQTAEGHDGFAVRREERVVGKRDGAEEIALHVLKAFVRLARSIRVELNADVSRQLLRDLRRRKHVGFHPPAVRARVAREVHEDWLIGSLRFGECGLVVVLDPRELTG